MIYRLLQIALIAIVLLSSNYILAQSKKEIKAEKKVAKDSVKQYKVDNGMFMISPIVVHGYTLELGGQHHRYYQVIS